MKFNKKFYLSLIVVTLCYIFVICPKSAQAVPVDETRPDHVTCVLSSSNLISDNLSSKMLYVFVKNFYYQPLVGMNVAPYTSFQGLTFSPTELATDGQGQAVFTLKSTKPGTASIRLNVGGYDVSCTEVIIGQEPSATNSSIEASPLNVSADGSSKATLKFIIRDASNNPIANKTFTLKSEWSGNNADYLILPAPTKSTDSNGVTIYEVMTYKAGYYYGTLTDGDSFTKTSPTINFVSVQEPVFSEANSLIIRNAPYDPILADGVQFASITVRINDEDGNVMPGVNVSLLPPNSSVIVSAASQTDASGNANFSIKSTKSGNFNIAVSVDGVTMNSMINLDFVKPVSASKGTFSLSPSVIQADGSQQSTATVVVRDEDGNTLANKTVYITSSPSGLLLSDSSLVTNSNGSASFRIRSNTAGTFTLKATVDSMILSQQPTLTVNSADTNNSEPSEPVQVDTTQSNIAYAYYSSLVSDKTSAPAYTGITFTATFKNSEQGAIVNRLVNMTFQDGDLEHTASDYTNSSGKTAITFFPTQAGQLIAKAYMDDVTLTKTVTITEPASTPSDANTSVGDIPETCAFEPGSLFKLWDDSNPLTQHDTAIYYYGKDCKRHAFPNGNVYFTWYEDFNNLTIVTEEELARMPLGANVMYRPGKLLVKFYTDPKVYAVGKGGVLRWVMTEDLAKILYGLGWNQMIHDIPDTFFADYKFGDPIESNLGYSRLSELDMSPTIDDLY